MKLIVGLGNPGDKYKNNRHNVGFMVIDRLVEELRDKGYGLNQEWEGSKKGKLQYIWFETKSEIIELVKPLTFMNESGYSVVYAYKKHSLSSDDLYIIHDDLDIPLGSYKIQKDKGPRLHGGVNSIERSLGTDSFWRVRVGIENRNKESGIMNNGHRKMSGEDYVLQDFAEKELEILEKTINNMVEELIKRIG